jgi:tetratricopeptide (TPR) repeat protein
MPVVMASGFPAYEAVKTAALLGGGALLWLLWAAHALRGQALALRGGLALLPLLGLGVLAAASALWAPNAWKALVGAARWWALGAVVFTALAPAGRPVRAADAAAAVGLGASLAALVGLGQRFGLVLDPLAPGASADGLRGSFDHARYAALSLAVGAPLLLGGLSERGPRLALSASGLALSGLYLGITLQPHAWIVAAVGVLAALGGLALARAPQKTLITAAAASVGLAALVAVGALFLKPADEAPVAQSSGKLTKARFGLEDLQGQRSIYNPDWGRPNPPDSPEAREFARKSAMNLFAHKPALGVGANNWDNLQARFVERASPWYQNTLLTYPAFRAAHESYLQLGAELGVVGLLLFVAFVALVLATAARALRAAGAQPDAPQALPLASLAGASLAFLTACGLEAALELTTSALWGLAALGLLLREGLAGMEVRRGLAQTWSLMEGAPMGQRVAAGALFPVVAAGLGLYAAVTLGASEFYKARGDVWLKAGAGKQSEEAYAQALRFAPGNDLARYNRVQALTGRGTFAQVEPELLTLSAQRPYDPRVFYALGEAQMREATRRAADKNKAQLPAVQPGEPKPKDSDLRMLASMMERVDPETVKQATANLERARDLHPRYLDVYEQLYECYSLQQDYKKARASLDEGLAQLGDQDHPRAAVFHMMLGQSYMLDEAWNDARKHYDMAIALDPQSPRRSSIERDIDLIETRRLGKHTEDDGHGHGAHGHGPPVKVPSNMRFEPVPADKPADGATPPADGAPSNGATPPPVDPHKDH